MNLVEISKKFPACYERMMGALTHNKENQVAFALRRLAMSHLTARSLLDFFDDYGIYVTTQYILEKEWYAVVHHKDQIDIVEDFPTRKDAEEHGVLKAFQLLENELQ